jgi:hypothetical protein
MEITMAFRNLENVKNTFEPASIKAASHSRSELTGMGDVPPLSLPISRFCLERILEAQERGSSAAPLPPFQLCA